MYFHYAISGKVPPIIKNVFFLKIRYLMTLIYVRKKSPHSVPKRVQLRYCETIYWLYLLIVQPGWKFPTAWSEKPNHQRIGPRKYFQATLYFKNFETKNQCLCKPSW